MQSEPGISVKGVGAVDIKNSEQEICHFIQQSLNKIIKNEKYTSYKIVKKPFSSNGGNFLGDLLMIDIKGETEDGFKESNIFIKRIALTESIMNGTVNPKCCHMNEVMMYTKIKDIFDELYDEANVPVEERLRMVKIYDCSSHVIALENLSLKGYRTFDRFELMTFNFALETMKQLAKFHALSFVLENKRNDIFGNILRSLKPSYNFEVDNGSWEEYVVIMMNASFKEIKEIYQGKKNNLMKNILIRLKKYMTGELSSVKCMCHADFKLNNVLVRENMDGKTDPIIIDYQLLSYKSPVIDILFFLYTGSDLSFRKNHLNSLKDVYHNTLGDSLRYFSMDVDKIYPRHLFEKDFEDHIEYGLMISVTILPMILANNPELFGGDKILQTPTIDDRYKERIDGIMEEFTERGIL